MTQTLDVRTKLQVTCHNCSLSELCIPRGLNQCDIDRISQIVGRKKTLQKGDYLYRKGDRFRGILAIKAGTAKIVTMDQSGNEYMTAYLLPGELLGFDALADDRHTCSAMALETLSYCELPAEQLDALCRDVPNLLRELFRHAGNTLAAETSQIVLAKRPAEERVAGFLINLSDRLARRGFSPLDFRLSLTRQEIGNFLGLALETVSRILKSFEDGGLIEVNYKQIRIQNLDGLRRLCAEY
ncbi:MAG: fumarate/nitrate reduction transcriptional regulator Fnr [Methylococcaceae bacterium]|nr:fumarate/nitrate reduction transcriptional regulator Fnr [Methylococcaceae bacterium]